MSRSTLKLESFRQKTEAGWISGYVVDIAGDSISIEPEQSETLIEARKAVSCLIEPEIGDLVNVFVTQSGKYFLMDVIERFSENMESSSEIRLQTAGKFVVAADKGIRLETIEQLEIEAPKMQVQVEDVQWWSKLVALSSEKLKLSTTLSKMTTKLSELLCDRMVVGANRSVRTVTEAEHIRAGVFDVKADKLASFRGKCTTVTGKELVKVDASQVHIG